MKYKYIPDSYDREKMEQKKLDELKFLEYQVKYKNSVEALLSQMMDFSKVDTYLTSLGLKVPKPLKNPANFYQTYSRLNSDFLYLRNNMHVENLSVDELKEIDVALQEKRNLDVSFLNKTCDRVLFEENDIAMYGIPKLENQVPSKSLVFEFAYYQKGYTSMEQLLLLDDHMNDIKDFIKQSLNPYVQMPIAIIVNNTITDIYGDAIKKKISHK